jgi:flagellar hook-basal body complex protein FliE
MTINALNATTAYRNQLKLQEGIKDSLESEQGAGKASFSDLLGESLKGSLDTLKQSEAVKMESLTGKVELTDLVTAISSAELTLNTVVAVRDKVISAYQDIIRMPI